MIYRWLVIAFAVALSGCNFSRTVVNRHVRELDTSWIEAGKTTRSEIMAQLGRPPAPLEVMHVRKHPKGMDIRGEDVDSQMTLRWSTIDSFSGSFEGGQWIIPTFSKGYTRRAHDILIIFDEQDRVKILSRTEVVNGIVNIVEWKEASK